MGAVLDRLVDRRLARAAGAHWMRVDGQRFHARHAGPEAAAAPPVVCVHGVGVSSRYMVATMAELASAVEVYAIDLPGFGLTDKPPEVLDVVGLADALAAWIRALGLERPAFLANSVGCQIVVDCAVRYPDCLSRMVLVGPTIDPAARTAPRQVLRWLGNLPGERPGQLPLMVADYADAGVGRALRTFSHALADRIEDKLPLVQAPTLVVRGACDRIVPQAWAEEVTRLLPRGRLAVIPGPHTLNFAAPGALAELVRPFLVEAEPA
jgi:2-hydroxy-6-oxonona-2,4-dienedioate hydrolase